MDTFRYREGLVLLAVCLMVQPARVQPENQRLRDDVAVRTDVYGEPLPPGALVRMGSLRLRHAISTVMPLVFSRDGKTILSASGVDRKIRAWDVSTRQEKFTRALAPISEGGWAELAFSADATKVAARTDHTKLFVCDVADGKRLHEFEAPLSFARQIALSSDGRLLATGHSNFSILIWDTANGKKREFRVGEGHLAHDVFFSPDDRRIAMVSHDAITVFDVATGKRLRVFPNQMGLVSTQIAAFTPDGQTLAAWITVKDSGVVLYDVDSGKEVWRIPGHGSPVLFSPDGTLLATSGEDSIHLWDVAGKKEIHVIEKSGNALAFAPDGRRLAFRRGAAILLFDLTTGKLTPDERGHMAGPSIVTFSPDGRTVASAFHASDVRLWDTATGKQLRAFRGEGRGSLNVLALTGRLLIAGSDDGTVMRWDAVSGKPMPPVRVPGKHLALRRSHDGTMLIATTRFAEDDKSYPVSGWDLESGKELFKRRQAQQPLFPAFVSRAGKPLAHLAFGNIAASWVQDRLRLREPIAFSPDGKIVAVSRRVHEPDPAGSIEPNPVEAVDLYDSATAKLLRRIEAGPLGDLCFSPDSRYLVAAAPDRLRLWEVVSGLELFVRPAHERFTYDWWYGGREGDSFASSLAFAPDCRKVATGLPDSTILLWDMVPPAPPRAAAPDAKVLTALWSDLAGTDGRAVHRAVWTIVSAGDSGVAFLKARMPPTPFPDVKRVHQLLDDLNSDRFKVREAAMREFRALGEVIVPFLDAAQKEKRSLEFHNRLESLRDGVRVVQSAETLRRLRAAQALEYIGTPAARWLLTELAKGAPGSRVTQEARASLQRLAEH